MGSTASEEYKIRQEIVLRWTDVMIFFYNDYLISFDILKLDVLNYINLRCNIYKFVSHFIVHSQTIPIHKIINQDR